MMRPITAAGLGGLALFMVVCCSSKKDKNENANAGGNGGIIFADSGTDGSSGTQLEPCPVKELDQSCTAASTSATLNTVNMLILLDKSGSMGKPGLGSTTSKWDAMKSALSTALDRAKLTINFGLDLFPGADVSSSCTGEACCATAAVDGPLTVPIAPGTDTVTPILSTLAGTTPAGGTPMAAALAHALNYFTAGDGGAGLVGDKYVLLVTDGGPNCDTAAVPSCDSTKCTRNLDPDPSCSAATNCCSTSALAVNCLDDGSVTTQIQALADAGIKTIVVGVPGSENYVQYLNGFAQTGGMPQSGGTTAYYAVAENTGTQGLVDTLQKITINLVKSCVITYTTPPQDPQQVTVLVDCKVIPRDPLDGGDGTFWTLDPGAKTITIGGPTCTNILNQGVKRVDYIFGCAIPVF